MSDKKYKVIATSIDEWEKIRDDFNHKRQVFTFTPEKEENTGNSTDNGTEIRKEFKEAMDSYESYMNEYVEFMKKYYANPSDTSLLRDYTKMLEKYNKLTKDFENWKDNNLNTAEASYYLDVQTRVTKKLLEITNQ